MWEYLNEPSSLNGGTHQRNKIHCPSVFLGYAVLESEVDFYEKPRTTDQRVLYFEINFYLHYIDLFLTIHRSSEAMLTV